MLLKTLEHALTFDLTGMNVMRCPGMTFDGSAQPKHT